MYISRPVRHSGIPILEGNLLPLNKDNIVDNVATVIEDAHIMTKQTHTPAYILPFLVGKILIYLTETVTESQLPQAALEVRIFRPQACDLISIKINCQVLVKLVVELITT